MGTAIYGNPQVNLGHPSRMVPLKRGQLAHAGATARPSGGSTCVVAYTNWTKLSFGIFYCIYIYILYMYNNYNMCVYVGTHVCRHVGLYVCVCMYMFVCICMFRMFFVRFCMYLYDLYVFVCICTGLCVCVLICICMFVFCCLLAAGKL